MNARQSFRLDGQPAIVVRAALGIGRTALYLASDASSFMTGSDLLIDGGYRAV